MKKKISNIFDEAKASEIETLVSQNEACDLSPDTLSAVKEKVYAKMGMGKMKMKKSFNLKWKIFVAIVACFALIVSAIVVPMHKNKKVEYTLYHETSDSISTSTATELGISISSSDELKLIDTVGNKKEKSTAPEKLKYSFLGKELDLILSYSMENGLSNSKYESLRNVSEWDCYKTEDRGYLLDIYPQTKEVRFFFDKEASRKVSPNKITDEEAKNIAYDILVNLYGKETADEYAAYSSILESSNQQNTRAILFSKYIGKYRLEDDILIFLNNYGEIGAINATKKGSCNHIIGKVTESQIQAAENKVKELFADKNATFTVHGVEVGEDGIPYLCMSVGIPDENGKVQYRFYYINII